MKDTYDVRGIWIAAAMDAMGIEYLECKLDRQNRATWVFRNPPDDSAWETAQRLLADGGTGGRDGADVVLVPFGAMKASYRFMSKQADEARGGIGQREYERARGYGGAN